jgi:hypothetical protein
MQSSLHALPSSNSCPGLVQTFFWDKLPQGRVAGTFWAAHPPDYGLLAPSIPEAEELFQVRYSALVAHTVHHSTVLSGL